MLCFPIKTPISLEPTKTPSVKPRSARFCSTHDPINTIAGIWAQLQILSLDLGAQVEPGGVFWEAAGSFWVPTTSVWALPSKLRAKRASTSLHTRGVPSVIDYTTASLKTIVFFISMQMNYFSRKPFVLNAICLHYGANPLQGRFLCQDWLTPCK